MPTFLKRLLVGLVVVVFAAVVFAFTMLPSVADQRINAVYKYAPYSISVKAQEAHKQIPFIADLHADSLLWKRDLLRLQIRGHVDVPRLVQARVALQVFSIVTKAPFGQNAEKTDPNTLDLATAIAVFQGWPQATWGSLFHRALHQTKKLHKFAAKSDGLLTVIRNQRELKLYLQSRKIRPKVTAGLLAIEGAHALEGKLANVDKLFKAGVRMIAATHFFDNRLCGSAHGIKKGGLTAFGKKVIKRMEKLKIIVDLAHVSPKGIEDTLAMVKRPVVVSHTGVKGTCNNMRNLSDRQIKMIAKNGGIIGLGLWEKAVCGTDAMATAKAMRYVADLVGVKHVALGSDFDGGIKAPWDIRGLPFLVEAMTKLKFTPQDIAMIMGGNFLRILKQTLPEK